MKCDRIKNFSENEIFMSVQIFLLLITFRRSGFDKFKTLSFRPPYSNITGFLTKSFCSKNPFNAFHSVFFSISICDRMKNFSENEIFMSVQIFLLLITFRRSGFDKFKTLSFRAPCSKITKFPTKTVLFFCSKNPTKHKPVH